MSVGRIRTAKSMGNTAENRLTVRAKTPNPVRLAGARAEAVAATKAWKRERKALRLPWQCPLIHVALPASCIPMQKTTSGEGKWNRGIVWAECTGSNCATMTHCSLRYCLEILHLEGVDAR